MPPSFRKTVGALWHKGLSRYPLSTTFSLLLVAGEVWYISNKYWVPNKSAKKYFYTIHLTHLLHLTKKEHSLWQKFQKHPLFTSFQVGEECNISNKYWPY